MKPHLLLATLLWGLLSSAAAQAGEPQTAVFAGGCFWCVEKDFEKHEGVIEAVSGYAGGHLANPTYKQVSNGGTGHLEVVQVTYDPEVITYEDLLEIYWANIDPLDDRGQFCDKGESYKAAIFYSNHEDMALAEQSKDVVTSKLGKPVATTIRELSTFYPAEDYHQNYYKTNETKYKFYRWRCGRDARLKEIWGDAALHSITIFAQE